MNSEVLISESSAVQDASGTSFDSAGHARYAQDKRISHEPFVLSVGPKAPKSKGPPEDLADE